MRRALPGYAESIIRREGIERGAQFRAVEDHRQDRRANGGGCSQAPDGRWTPLIEAQATSVALRIGTAQASKVEGV
jgi:hypothetical protein